MTLQLRHYTAATFDAFVQQPENADKNFELIGGEIIEVVSNNYSSEVAMMIATHIGMYLLQNKIGRMTGADGGYRVSGERYIPDVAFIALAKQPAPSYDAYNPNAPDLAIEVLSPGNTDDEMTVKIANYLAAGTTVWRVKPLEKEVAIFAPGQPVKILTINDVLDGGVILPGFSLPVRDIFPEDE